MKKKIITISFVVWAFAAIWDTSPAKAYFAIPISDISELTEVVPTPKNMDTTFTCGTFHFNKLQLMGVPGFGRVWILVESLYRARGVQDAVLITTCVVGGDTYNIYSIDGN